MCTPPAGSSLPLADASCACCSTSVSGSSSPTAELNATSGAVVAQFQVDGMTCGHCVASVTEEVSQLAGVTAVTVDLVAGGTSTVSVTSDIPLDDETVASAVDEAGYQLVAPVR
jgi:copper chaperone